MDYPAFGLVWAGYFYTAKLTLKNGTDLMTALILYDSNVLKMYLL